MSTRRYVCPSCKQKAGVNIECGYPGPEMAEAAERGENVLVPTKDEAADVTMTFQQGGYRP